MQEEKALVLTSGNLYSRSEVHIPAYTAEAIGDVLKRTNSLGSIQDRVKSESLIVMIFFVYIRG